MKILNYSEKILLFSIFLALGGCGEKIEEDPCMKTKWIQSKEYEIVLTVRISGLNPLFSSGSAGSQKPFQFEKMVVSGSIEKVECNNETTGPVSLGNSYITQELDEYPEPIEDPIIYGIGHVVYVYEFDNDEDKVSISLSVKITMADGQSYKCSMDKQFFSEEIKQVAGELYYSLLLDVNSDSWVKD